MVSDPPPATSFSDNTVLSGVLQGQEILLVLGLIAHVKVLLAHDHHDFLAMKTPNNDKNVSGSIVTGKATFVYARNTVNKQHGDFFFHCSQGGEAIKQQRQTKKKGLLGVLTGVKSR